MKVLRCKKSYEPTMKITMIDTYTHFSEKEKIV